MFSDNAAKTLRSEAPSDEAAEQAYGLGALLSALSTVLRDTTRRFEHTSGQVTTKILTQGDQADQDLIMALQDFDRLQQEFSALSDVIRHCAARAQATPDIDSAWSKLQALSEITIADVRHRLLDCLRQETVVDSPLAGTEQVF